MHGCQSKKYFYEAAEAVAKCRHLSGRGITRLPDASWRAIVKEKNKFTDPIPENTIKNLKCSGIDFYRGSTVFTGLTTLDAGDQKIQGRFIIIASGADPIALPIKGGEHMITSPYICPSNEVRYPGQ